MAKTQKNFYVDDDFVTWFDAWCDENGYTGTTVFQAAMHKFVAMTHDERRAWFAKVGTTPHPQQSERISKGNRRKNQPKTGTDD